MPANGGVFQYGSAAAYPTQSYQSSNYWVDVVFSLTPPADTISPTVTSTNPANGATNIGTTATVTITFSEALDPTSVSADTIRVLAGGTQIAAGVAYNAANRTVTLTPAAPLGNFQTFTISDLGGNGRREGPGGQCHATNLHLDIYNHGGGHVEH